MKGRFLFHTLITFKEMILGFTLAITCGAPLAYLIFRYQTMRSLLQPLFVLIQCIPMFALAPIMVIWFGWSDVAIIIPTALMIFFPLTLNLYQGLRSTPTPLVEFFQQSGATQWQSLIKLRLPAALPHVFSGLRLSAAIAGIGAVAGEWAGAQNGLGILMLESRRNSDLAITFAALACLSALSLTFYGTILLLESLWNKRLALSRHLITPLLLVALMAGCTKKEHTTLLLDWLPNPNHIPLYVGVEKGYFVEEGIDLKVQKMWDNGGAISYLTSGKVDLILGHLPGMLKASSMGAKLTLVAELIPNPLRALIYRYDLQVTTPSDLSNTRLGYCIGGPDTTFLDYLLAQGGITPLTRKNVSADLIAAMGTKAVDFIYGGYWNIEPHQLRAVGLDTQSIPIEELNIPSYQELIVIGTQETNATLAQGFRKALSKSIAFCKAFPEEAFEIYIHQTPDKSNATIDWQHSAWLETYPLFPDHHQIDQAKIATFHDWQLEQGILPTAVDLDHLLLN